VRSCITPLLSIAPGPKLAAHLGATVKLRGQYLRSRASRYRHLFDD
jgi:hypothetical protein